MVGEREQDLEVLRGLYAKWSAGDFDSVEEFADDIVWIPRVLDGGEYRGIEEMTAAWRGFLQSFSAGFRIEAEEIVPGGRDTYLVMQTFRGTGRTSGVDTQGKTALVVTMRNGKIARMEGFWDRDQALAAAGLRT
jgi:ketosteroid isomerase-like protein